MFKIAKRVLLSWTLPALAAMASPPSMAAEPAGLIYRTGEEVVFEVTSNGLSRITFQGRSLATGEWSVFNAESWFSRSATNGPVRSGRCQERTLEVLSPAHYRVWSGLDNWEIYRWLCPGSELAARLYEKKGQAPAGFETPDEFYTRHGVIPLVPVNDFSRAPGIKALQAAKPK